MCVSSHAIDFLILFVEITILYNIKEMRKFTYNEVIIIRPYIVVGKERKRWPGNFLLTYLTVVCWELLVSMVWSSIMSCAKFVKENSFSVVLSKSNICDVVVECYKSFSSSSLAYRTHVVIIIYLHLWWLEVFVRRSLRVGSWWCDVQIKVMVIFQDKDFWLSNDFVAIVG